MEDGSRFRGRKYGTQSRDIRTMLGMVYVVQVWWRYRLGTTFSPVGKVALESGTVREAWPRQVRWGDVFSRSCCSHRLVMAFLS